MKSGRFISPIALLLFALPQLVTGQGQSDERRPDFVQLVRRGESPPLRSITPTAAVPRPPRQIPNFTKVLPFTTGPTPATSDPLVQDSVSPTVPAEPTTAPILSFEGVSNDDNAEVTGGRIVPPDTEGDVGPNHYVQMINLAFEVFDKNGNSIFGPVANNTLWSGFGGVCEELNNGDPIVLYDHLADRWILSQFALGEFSATPGEADGHQCLAISQTPDPTGAYYLYDFIVTPSSDGGFSTFGINDYPKIGIWPDAYYMSVNEFQCSAFTGECSYQGVAAVAFERAAMLAGSPTARGLKASIPASASPAAYSLQPFHLKGTTSPPAGAPGQFVMSFDSETWGSSGADDGYRIWEFDVDWNDTSNSTFNEVPMVSTSEFDSNLCGFTVCVPQSGGELLDTLSQFTMYRAQYRNFGTHETLVVNHSVDTNGADRAGIRWAELRNIGDGWGLYQTGTFAPRDGEHRWMGSAAMDGSGNIALAYSRSSNTSFPSVVYTSRSEDDALGQLPGGEVICHAGTGAQVSSGGRWGDYSTISVDPVDDCTFWLTNEYYSGTASFDFETRICAFKLENCGPATCADDDGDGVTTCDGDCNDNDPSIFPGANEQCNGVDDNCDGQIDEGCPICIPTHSNERGPRCNDGIDNDCDGLTDGDDPDCGGACQITEDPEVSCSDGIDNDCDGLTDGNDPDCDPGCQITEDPEVSCSDGVDNDCDGLTDGADTDCGGACVPTTSKERGAKCNDGIDNDCDGLTDGDDPDCGGFANASTDFRLSTGKDKTVFLPQSQFLPQFLPRIIDELRRESN